MRSTLSYSVNRKDLSSISDKIQQIAVDGGDSQFSSITIQYLHEQTTTC